MNPPAAQRCVAGWFGKIPVLGDFATRRLPMSFVTPWDEWLSVELSEVRALWADQWSASYRQVPTLCFAIDAGLVDHQAWHGIMIPSHDRVGREFPLTLAQSRRPEAAAPMERRWWAGLVATGRRALEPHCRADEFDTAVDAFFSGPSEELAGLQTPAYRSGWWRWDAGDSQQVPVDTATELPRGEQFRKLLENPTGMSHQK